MKRKTIIEVILHLIFWVICFYYFTNNSLLRFFSFDIREEYYSLLLIIVVIYFNYFWLIPRFFNRRKLYYYFSLLLSALLLITTLEFLMLLDDIKKITSNTGDIFENGVLRWEYFGIFFRDTLFVGFFTMFKIYRDAIKANKLLQEITALEKQKMRTEINMVKSKVNSHFFFNTLNSIYAIALEQSTETADMIANLSHLMHYVVADSENEWVTLNKEIEFLQNYSALEIARHQYIAFNFTIEGDTSQTKVPPMIFEAFANNAFKYTDDEGRGYINIHLECLPNDSLVFCCENNTRTTINTQIQSTSKGLQNTHERLELFYHNNYKLETTSEMGIYKVKLVLDIK